ncbi:hypothetical protein V4F87_003278 [Vibrio parahaemolyticus]|nr:hypothetical protein [Vibrio parahaemolyticus]
MHPLKQTINHKSKSHRIALSVPHRTHPIWKHYDDLYSIWCELGMPYYYAFAMELKNHPKYECYSTTYDFRNMVKIFELEWQEQMEEILTPIKVEEEIKEEDFKQQQSIYFIKHLL